MKSCVAYRFTYTGCNTRCIENMFQLKMRIGDILVKITDRMFSISLTEKLPIPRKVDFDCFEISDQAFPFPFKMADQ